MLHEGIESIELIYENCEAVTIPRKYILDIIFIDFKRSFRRVAVNAIRKLESYSHVILEIDGKCEAELCNQEFFGNESSMMDFLSQRRDITSINVIYVEGHTDKNFSFRVNWDDDYSNNRNQENLRNDFDDVAIVITPGDDDGFSSTVKEFTEGFFDEDIQKYKKELYSMD